MMDQWWEVYIVSFLIIYSGTITLMYLKRCRKE